MALYTTSLNSGSNGNCYYVGNESEAVIIDAGLSCRETEKRMQMLGLNMKKVKPFSSLMNTVIILRA